MAAMPAKILIGTPITDFSVTLPYFESVRRLERQLEPRASFDFIFPQSAMLVFSRNVIANIVLRDESYSHLLFVDADMGFAPHLIEKMLDFDKPIVGCVAPARHLDMERLHAASRANEDARAAELAGQTYLMDEPPLATSGSFHRVRYTGTGIMLIQRTTLVAMGRRFPELWSAASESPYHGLGLEGSVFQCFNPLKNQDNVYFAEDMSFCLRWTMACGGEIWVCADETIVHLGRVLFTGNYRQAQNAPSQECGASCTVSVKSSHPKVKVI